jgi:hypothetical protein
MIAVIRRSALLLYLWCAVAGAACREKKGVESRRDEDNDWYSESGARKDPPHGDCGESDMAGGDKLRSVNPTPTPRTIVCA